MCAAAAGKLHLQELVTDEVLGDSAVRKWNETTAAAATRTAFPDPVLLDDERVLKLMLDREDREQATVVMLNGYESRQNLQLFMRRIVVTWMYEVGSFVHLAFDDVVYHVIASTAMQSIVRCSRARPPCVGGSTHEPVSN
jgi:hypothetical protein